MSATIGLPGLTADDRTAVSVDLQAVLVDLVALSLNGKQAHWHVTGRHFLPVHEQLDVLVADTRAWADLVAERAVALGAPVDGRAHTVAETTGVGEFPEGFLDDDKTVTLVSEQVAAATERIRARLEGLGRADLVTQDLVIEILRGLEKHLWMLQAQLA
jgi:starvation-inducible DNA-binding protein